MRPTSTIALLAAALLLAGCGGASTDAASDDPATGTSPSEVASSPSATENADTGSPTPTDSGSDAAEVDVTVEGDTISPTAMQLTVDVGAEVTLHVTSDRAGELHVHSSPEQELAFGSGKSDVSFTLDKPGQVDVEEHESDTLLLRILVR